MRERSHGGSKLFLTELIIAIFFFAVITAVCVQLFADAHVMSKRSGEITQSVNAAANAAEYYTVWDYNKDSWNELFPEGKWDKDKWQIYYDEQWQPCDGNGSYLMEMELRQEGIMHTSYIAVTDKQGTELYSLEVKRVHGE